MKKKLITTGIIGLSIVVLTVGLAQYADARPGAGHGFGARRSLFTGADEAPCHQTIRNMIQGNIGRLLTLRSSLDVTDSQREEIRHVVKEYRAEMLPIIEDIVESRRTLHEAVLVEQPDETTIRTAAANLGDAIAEAALLASDITVQIRPILTDEQIVQLQEFATERADAVDTCMGQCASLIEESN